VEVALFYCDSNCTHDIGGFKSHRHHHTRFHESRKPLLIILLVLREFLENVEVTVYNLFN
jgi:hypothetical protein